MPARLWQWRSRCSGSPGRQESGQDEKHALHTMNELRFAMSGNSLLWGKTSQAASRLALKRLLTCILVDMHIRLKKFQLACVCAMFPVCWSRPELSFDTLKSAQKRKALISKKVLQKLSKCSFGCFILLVLIWWWAISSSVRWTTTTTGFEEQPPRCVLWASFGELIGIFGAECPVPRKEQPSCRPRMHIHQASLDQTS